MTPEEHYEDAEACIDAARSMADSHAQHGDKDGRGAFVAGKFTQARALADLRLRAAEVGVMLGRPRGGKVEIVGTQLPFSEELAEDNGVTGLTNGITVADQLNAQRHAPPSVGVVPDGDSLTGFRIVANQPDTDAKLAQQTATLLKINGALNELDYIYSEYEKRKTAATDSSNTAALHRAYGRGIGAAVQRVREAMGTERGFDEAGVRAPCGFLSSVGNTCTRPLGHKGTHSTSYDGKFE